jgi:hypothetical protein
MAVKLFWYILVACLASQSVVARKTITAYEGNMCGGIGWCVNSAGATGLTLCRNTTAPWSDVICATNLTCVSMEPQHSVWACIGPEKNT